VGCNCCLEEVLVVVTRIKRLGEKHCHFNLIFIYLCPFSYKGSTWLHLSIDCKATRTYVDVGKTFAEINYYSEEDS